jgi:hypothetical protein
MATNTDLLMGETIDQPITQEEDIEKFLIGFLQALLEEQHLK